MPIIAKQPDTTFTPCPEGLHHAVCVDVVDLGIVDSPHGPKEKVRIVWQVNALNPVSGHRFDVRRSYNRTLHEKAALRKDLESWRGQAFTDAELKGFDVEKVLGANAQLQVIHRETDDGKTYANVQSIVPVPAEVERLEPLDYVREIDRPAGATS